MLKSTASLLVAFFLAALMSACHAHRPRSPRPLADDTYRRRSQMEEDIFDDDNNSEDEDSSEEEGVPGDGLLLSKRRKGPTLSVVNPLEILRQRLMLDLARRKIQENQQQIVANAHFLENIGKRHAT